MCEKCFDICNCNCSEPICEEDGTLVCLRCECIIEDLKIEKKILT